MKGGGLFTAERLNIIAVVIILAGAVAFLIYFIVMAIKGNNLALVTHVSDLSGNDPSGNRIQKTVVGNTIF